MPQWLQSAFATRGFTELTPIQEAVLRPELAGRDLRMSSATGSGKTVALAIALGESLETATVEERHGAGGAAQPQVLVVAPTRELAAQLRKELAQLYTPLNVHVALVLGGGSYRDELRALNRNPAVLVATPGRLVDHLKRGSVEMSAIRAVALDEADQLLELGFKDELDEILSGCPEERRTLLVSATFNDAVRRLADTHQRDALTVEGTPIGEPHADIEHVVHVIHGRDQLSAITNLLLLSGEDRALVFTTTRGQVTEFADMLAERNFSVGGLSGEMSQAERSRTLDAFRRGNIRVLVATDVAARGIDVQDVRLVIHAFPPRDAEALIHRSGRTGRAGQQGRSVQLVTPNDTRRLQRLFAMAKLRARVMPVPTPKEVLAEHDARMAAQLRALEGEDVADHRGQAEALLSEMDPVEVVARLLSQSKQQLPCQPEWVAQVEPPRARTERTDKVSLDELDGGFTPFEVTHGTRHGATPERLMAMVCRRGRVTRKAVGQIDIGEGKSRVEIANHVAGDFARSAGRRDARDRDIHIRPIGKLPAGGAFASAGPARQGRGGFGKGPGGGGNKPFKGKFKGKGDRFDGPGKGGGGFRGKGGPRPKQGRRASTADAGR